MSVYVDDMHKTHIGRYQRFRAGYTMLMSHMIADTPEELHAMADKIGVQRKWFQGDHYDIAKSKRALAVKFGAIEVSFRQAGAMIGVHKRTGVMPAPENAVEEFRTLLIGKRGDLLK